MSRKIHGCSAASPPMFGSGSTACRGARWGRRRPPRPTAAPRPVNLPDPPSVVRCLRSRTRRPMRRTRPHGARGTKAAMPRGLCMVLRRKSDVRRVRSGTRHGWRARTRRAGWCGVRGRQLPGSEVHSNGLYLVGDRLLLSMMGSWRGVISGASYEPMEPYCRPIENTNLNDIMELTGAGAGALS